MQWFDITKFDTVSDPWKLLCALREKNDTGNSPTAYVIDGCNNIKI